MPPKASHSNPVARLCKIKMSHPHMPILTALENSLVKLAVRRMNLFKLLEFLEDLEETFTASEATSNSKVA